MFRNINIKVEAGEKFLDEWDFKLEKVKNKKFLNEKIKLEIVIF